MTRRGFLLPAVAAFARPATRITRVELLPVQATARTVWLFVRLHASGGLSGLGEASDAFGFARTTKEQAARMESELRALFALIDGRSPLDIEWFRQQAWPSIQKEGLVVATAFSALEQAMWDLAGQALALPVCDLLGGAVRTVMPAYANINRSVTDRVPAGFAAAARRAVGDGFRAIKLAPFDGYPQGAAATAEAVKQHVDNGVASIAAAREAVGGDVRVMVDAHSFFTVPQAIEVAARLEPYKLSWYEEPVAPTLTAETLAIRKAVKQPMAGGEMLFALRGFHDLVETRAVSIIMPDVKHCGGLLELTRIAAAAAAQGVDVSPHNPSGPVATTASAHVCSTIANFAILEVQVGEAPWRAEVIDPPEAVVKGNVVLASGAGLGVRLRDEVVRKYAL